MLRAASALTSGHGQLAHAPPGRRERSAATAAPCGADHEASAADNRRMIELDSHDERLVVAAVAAMKAAFQQAHAPAAVAKRIAVVAVRHRNHGRDAARRRHPFAGICEASGKQLDKTDAVLDELQPELGYPGRVRWVCHKANNSGKRSCGGC